MAEKLTLLASTDLISSLQDAKYVIVATPTNYDEETNYFDTSTVEEVILQVTSYEPNACIIVKSTVPVGFTDDVRKRLKQTMSYFRLSFCEKVKHYMIICIQAG